jgi:hypothetical protein
MLFAVPLIKRWDKAVKKKEDEWERNFKQRIERQRNTAELAKAIAI